MWGLKSASSRTMSHLQGTLKSCSAHKCKQHSEPVSWPKGTEQQSSHQQKKPQHTVSKMRECQSIHHCLLALSGTESSPSPWDSFQSPSCVLTLSSWCRSTSCISSGSFPTRELLFHVPLASLNIWGSDCQEPTGGRAYVASSDCAHLGPIC